MKYTLFILFGLCFMCCKSDNASSGLQDYDLMKHGLPIKIKTKPNPVIEVDDLGFAKDVTISADDNFKIQLLSSSTSTTNPLEKKSELLKDVNNGPFFDSIIEENDNGFIFKKKISQERENYDFRYVKIQGDKSYVFQTSLIGKFTLEDVKMMYNAVQ